MDMNRMWAEFAVDAEVEHYGTSRIVKAHNALREALTEILKMDERTMYERCPDCENDLCAQNKRCKVAPRSYIGKLAAKALQGDR